MKTPDYGLRGLLVILISLLAACATDSQNNSNRNASRDDDKKRPIALSKLKLDKSYKLEVLWSTQVGKGLRRHDLGLKVALVGDRVYAADAFGLVAAFSATDGAPLWRVDLSSPTTKGSKKSSRRRRFSLISGGVSAGQDKVFVGTLDGQVFALNQSDGSVQWQARLSSEVLSAPHSDGDSVLVQSIDGQLAALKASNGERIWVYDNSVPRLSLRGTSSPVADQGLILTGFATGKLSALSAQGETVWESRVSDPVGRSELERMVDVDNAPLIDGDIVYAASYQGAIRAFRRIDGQILWEYKVNTSKAIASGFSQIYAIDEEGRIIAINAVTGTPVWNNDQLRHRKLTSPTVLSNYLVVPDRDGYIYILSQADGTLLTYDRLAAKGKGVRSVPAVASGIIYALAAGGRLSAMKVSINN